MLRSVKGPYLFASFRLLFNILLKSALKLVLLAELMSVTLLSLEMGLTTNPTDLVRKALFLRGVSVLSQDSLGLGDLLFGEIIIF